MLIVAAARGWWMGKLLKAISNFWKRVVYGGDPPRVIHPNKYIVKDKSVKDIGEKS